jgi:hypothetical protein
MSFGSATWEFLSARKGENTIVIKGDNASDVDLLTRWFENQNVVKNKEELDGQMIMTILGEIYCPEKMNEFGDATWGEIPSVPGESGVVIQGKNEDDVHNLANWFLANNTVKDVGFEICIRFTHSPIKTPLTNKWDSDQESDDEGDFEGDEGEDEGEDDESEEK